MSSDDITVIGDVAEIFDGPHATPKKTKTGPYFLSISSLNKGTLDLGQSAHLDEEDFKKWTRRITPQPSDVLFSYETRLGEAAMLPTGVRACLGRRMGLLRPDCSKIIPEYLLYAYLSPAFQSTIEQRKIHGATVDRISLKELPCFPIYVPSLEEQRLIVDNLASLDSKIQLNHQINQTLEQMAQALFKSWFVDFEPVKAKIAARASWQALQPENEVALPVSQPAELDEQPAVGDLETTMNRAAMQAISGKTAAQLDALRAEDPERYHELYETAALFPSAMQASELGEIPEGWNVAPIGQLCDVRKGLSYKGKHVTDDDSELPMINLGNFAGAGAFKAEKLKYYNGDYKKRHMVSAGQLMVANTDMTQNRIVLGSPIIVPRLSSDHILFTHHTFAVDFREEYPGSVWRNFIYFWCLQPSFRSRAGGFATGTTVLALPKDAFLKSEITISPDKVVHAFNKMVDGIFSQQEILVRQNATLTEIRDILLPRLLSGELTPLNTNK